MEKARNLHSCAYCDGLVVAAGLCGCGGGRADNRIGVAIDRASSALRGCWARLRKRTAWP